MKLSLDNFRRFHAASDIVIAPVTILVGENSSGKSSFLAALRYLVESISQAGESSFNKEPFFLGAYDQIAHYRGGRFGRSASFGLKMGLSDADLSWFREASDVRRGLHEPAPPGPASVALTFVNEQSQPVLQRVELEGDRLRLALHRDRLPEFTARLKESGERVRLGGRDEAEQLRLTPPARGTLLGTNNVQRFQRVYTRWAFNKRRETYQKRRDARVKKEEITLEPADKVLLALDSEDFGLSVLPEDAVYASAPFRTRPERTYSPIEATSSAEGSHIPILLAQAKSFDSKNWSRIKDGLESFGKASGMFKSVDIKRLGNSDSDPFQVIVTISRVKSNIIDVGYGVSQIMPLLVETMINLGAFIFLFQQPEVHLHPRGQAELVSFFLDFALRNKKYVILETHSDYVIDRIRAEISKRKLNPNDVLSILYFERGELDTEIHKIAVAENGEIVDPPQSYRNFFLIESLRTLGLAQ